MFKKIIVCLLIFVVSVCTFGCASANLSVRYIDGAMIQEVSITIDQSVVIAYKNKGVNIVDKVADVLGAYNADMEQTFLDVSNEWLESNSAVLQYHADAYRKTTGVTEMKIQDNKIHLSKNFGSIYAYLFFNNPYLFEYNEETDTLKLTQNMLVDVPMDSTFEKLDQGMITKYVETAQPLLQNNAEPTFKRDWYMTKSAGAGGTYGREYGIIERDEQISQRVAGYTVAGYATSLEGATFQDVLKAVFTGGENYTIADAGLKYQYKTPYNRVHSNGTVTKENGYFVHTWNLDAFDDTIQIYRSYANTTWWYVAILGISFVVVGVLLAVGLILRNKKKKKEEAEKNKNLNWIDKIY